MDIKSLLNEIPSQAQYAFKMEYFGFRYYCSLEIINGPDSTIISASSHELKKAIEAVRDRLISQIKSKLKIDNK